MQAGAQSVAVRLRVLRLDLEPADPGLLDDFERDRAARLVQPDHRRRYLARHAATRRELAGLVGLPPAEVHYSRACERCGDPAHGRPRLAAGGPHFSVSTAEDISVLAVCEQYPVGVDVVDVARIRRMGVTPHLVRTAFGRVRADCADAGGFAEAWAHREAVGKCLGTGLVGLPEDPVGVTSVAVPLQVSGRDLECALALRMADARIRVNLVPHGLSGG